MRKIIALFAFCLLLALAACGRARQTTDDTTNETSNAAAEATERPGVAPPVEVVHTLTTLAPYCAMTQEGNDRFGGMQGSNIDAIRAAAFDMRMEWAQRGETFYLDREHIQWDDWHNWDMRNQRLSLQMMAGDMPDIILFHGQNKRAMAERGFLVNFYDLIDQDSYLSRDDFFTQALSAFEISGGLYTLPVSFGFQHVRIHPHLPQHFIDEFTQKSFITVDEMMDLYLRLMAGYGDDFGNFSLGIPTSWNENFFQRTFDDYAVTPFAVESSIIFESIAVNYVDFNASTADFTNPGFVSSMAALQQIFARDIVPRSYGGTRVANPLLSGIGAQGRGDISDRFSDWVFIVGPPDMRATQLTAPIWRFMLYYYDHDIPLVDNQGRLLISPYPIIEGGSLSHGGVWASIGITASADRDVAWEFVKHLLSAYGRQSTNIRATPILREYFGEHTLYNINLSLERSRTDGYTFAESDEKIGAYFVERMAIYNEMPMALLSTMMPTGLYEENLDLFLREVISTEDFIHRLQNSVALWLIE